MFEIGAITLTKSDDKAKVKDAEARKKSATETMEEAWERILSLKNTDKEVERLLDVKRLMENGTVGRDPEAKKKFSRAEAMRIYEEVKSLLREEKLEALVATKPDNYILISSLAELKALLVELRKEPIIAVDTETTGLDWFVDVIIGVSFTLPIADKHYYIPFLPTQDERAFDSAYLEQLKDVMEDPDILKVFHNAMFDIAMFRRHGIELKGLAWDTQMAMSLLREDLKSYALKNLAPMYVGGESDTFGELFGKNAKFAEVPLDVAIVYACKDTHLTWKLYEFQLHHMEKMPEVLDYYRRVEVPLLYAILDMQQTGFVIDLVHAEEYGKRMKTEIDTLELEIKVDLGDREININSTQQLKPALERKTLLTLNSLDAKKVLKPLRKKHEIIDKYLRYKELSKLYGTYISKLPEKIHPKTERLHTRFDPMGTVTGRFSSGKDEENSEDQAFNVQNQPQDVRPIFLAPPKKVLIGADWSQQEVRCMAYFTQEPVLVNAYQQGLDIYASMASEFFGKTYEECGDGSKERKVMKVIVLAVMYGMGPKALAEMLDIDKKQAKQFIDDLFAKMPLINSFIESTQKFAKKHGYVWMDKKQRKRRLPEAKLKEKEIPWGKFWDDEYAEQRKHNGKVSKALRQGPNAKIQGTSAIQTKTTIVKVHEWLKDKPGWELWCTVHDELIIEAPEDFTLEELREYEKLMVESYVFGDIPNKTDMEVFTRWGEGVNAYEWVTKRNGEETI